MHSSAPDTLIGTVLEGQFRVERLIGRGGMGRVYVAESLRLRRRCALKVLLPELTADPRCVERFLREAQAIAQIHHENVVDIHHLGEDPSGIVFFAMELLSGEDLASRLKRRDEQPLDWRAATRLMLQVARAIIAVHAAGLIHRDLKPSNVFIARMKDGSPQVKLLDFGIVKADDQATLTGTGTVIGTASYMSPEQIQGDRLDRRCDIYSFGVLFYEALAGRRPFTGEPVQVAYHHCHTAPTPLRSHAPEVPRELEQLVMSMLAKDVGERVQTAEAIEQILLEILAEKPSDAPVTAPSREPPRAWVVPAAAARAGTAVSVASPDLVATKPRALVASGSRSRPAGEPRRSQPASPSPAGPPLASAAAPMRPRPANATRASGVMSLALLGLFAGGIAIVVYGLASDETPEARETATSTLVPTLVALPPDEAVAVQSVDVPATEPPMKVDPGKIVSAVTDVTAKEKAPVRSKRADDPSAPDPAAARQLAAQGTEALTAGRRSEAETLFNKAIGRDRRCAEALIGLSDIHFDRGSSEQAQNYAAQAVAVAASNSEYRLKLGDAYYKGARYQDALTQYETAQQLGNDKAGPRVAKARAKLGAAAGR